MPTLPLHSLNQYYIGEVKRNYSVFSRHPWAYQDIATAKHEQGTRFDAYQSENVWLAPELKGVILEPDFSFTDMVLADFTAAAGTIATTIPPGTNPQPVHIHATDAGANVVSDIRSTFSLPTNPSFAFLFSRQPMTPAGMLESAQQWRLTFGGYTLQWGRGPVVQLLQGSELIAKRQGEEGEWEAFGVAPELSFNIFCVLGNIYVCSSAWSGAWKVADIGDVPAGPIRMQGNGGEYAFNLSPFVFATSGYFITDWINTGGQFPSEFGSATMVKPDPPAGCSTALSVYAEDGPRRRYKITLTGNGATTPVVQFVQPHYDAAFINPNEYWQEITHWVDQTQSPPTETLPADLTARTLELTLFPEKSEAGTNNKTLWEWVGQLDGEYAFYYRTGMKYTDGTTEQSIRGYGFVEVRSGKEAAGDVPTLRLQVVDKWVRLARTALVNAPCVAEMEAGAAIALLAQYAGIPPLDIQRDDTGFILDGGGDDWTNPPWLFADGTTAAEAIRQIADAYGLIVEFGDNGKLQIRLEYNPTPMLTVDCDAGADPLEAVSATEATQDRNAAVNVMTVEGQRPDGRPITARLIDYDSLNTAGSPRFLGYRVERMIKRSDLSTHGSVNVSCAREFDRRPAAWPGWSLASKTARLYKCRSNRKLTLIKGGVTTTPIITNVTTQLGAAFNDATVTVEDRDA